MASPSASARYAYVHGFASGPLSTKGCALAARFAERGIDLEQPDLNRPSFAELTYSAALTAIDELTGDGDTWRFVGSSMGGYLAARCSELRPVSVDRMVLLCPAFDLPGRWREMLGGEEMERWRREGFYTVEDGAGVPTPVHYGLYEDVARHPPYPVVSCPTLVIHGRDDDVVPIASSRRYAAAHPDRVRLVELDDDHRLLGSVDQVARLAIDFLAVS